MSKSIQELLLDGDDLPEGEVSIPVSDDEACPRCGIENDSGAAACWSCGSRMVLPTLAEYGRKLPIGVVSGDSPNFKLNKRFDIIPLTWPIERAIGRYWTKKREALNLSEYIGAILAYTVSQVGETDMTKMKMPDRLLFFNQMFMADVFYMYAYLRLISLGSELSIRGLVCTDPSCSHRFNYTADVSSLGVVTIDDTSALERTITLPNGFEMAGETRKKLVLRPPKWGVMAEPNFTRSEQDIFETTFSSSVVEIDGLGRGVAMLPHNFDSFTKTDIEYAKEEADPMFAGPKWTVEGKCPKCSERFFFELDWKFDSFFGRSFVSRQRRNRSKK